MVAQIECVRACTLVFVVDPDTSVPVTDVEPSAGSNNEAATDEIGQSEDGKALLLHPFLCSRCCACDRMQLSWKAALNWKCSF